MCYTISIVRKNMESGTKKRRRLKKSRMTQKMKLMLLCLLLSLLLRWRKPQLSVMKIKGSKHQKCQFVGSHMMV